MRNVTLIIIWIISSAILIKCFSSVLLNNYFNIKIVTFINTFEELLEAKDIGISINLRDNPNAIFLELDPEKASKLRILIEKYDKKIDKNRNIERLSQVIERRAVYLLSSWDSAIHLHFLKGYNLVIAEEKFGFTFMSYMISKKHKFAKIIRKS